jgi:ribosomal protein S20
MSRKTKVFVAGALVFALLVLGVGGAVVLAQSPSPTQPGTTLGQLFWQALASRLGITTDKLQQTVKDARTDAINNAVKQGLITQAQADRMLQRLQNPPSGGNPSQPGKGFGAARGFFGANVLEAVAKVLNMNPADVTTALRGGKTLADLAKSRNVDPSKVQSAIAEAEKAALDRAVTDGLITQDRANTLKANIDPSKINLSRPFSGLGSAGRAPSNGPGGLRPFGRFGGVPKPTPTPKSS